MATLESLDGIVGQIKENIKELSTYESACYDCQRDKDLCPDCDMGDKYLSPDQIDPKENR